MNTTTHHRTGTALAAVLVAFVLPLAACQTPRPAQPVQHAGSVHTETTRPWWLSPSPNPSPNPGPSHGSTPVHSVPYHGPLKPV